MQTLRMYHGSVNQRYIDAIVDALTRDSAVIVTPNAGDNMLVACLSTDTEAVARAAAITRTDLRRDPLTLYCDSISQASAMLRIDNEAFAQLKAQTPGPSRIELQVHGSPARQLKARRTIGVVIPDDDITRAIARHAGAPLLGIVAGWDDSDLDPANAEAVAEYYGTSNFTHVIIA